MPSRPSTAEPVAPGREHREPPVLIVWPDGPVPVLPRNTPNAYAERQRQVAHLAQDLTARNPHLVAFDPARPKTRSVALAAKNARVLLKRAFPGNVFGVQSERYAMGSTLHVEWTDWADGTSPSRDAVNDLLRPFVTGKWNGLTEDFDDDEDLYREAFRHAFGSTRDLSLQQRMASPEERVRHERQQLQAVIDTVPADTRTPAPSPRQPRRL